jgi:nucleotide-binding universal stress UspA family protein
MEPLNKWLVGLDLTDHDPSILAYTKLLSDILEPDHIEFVYIADRLPDAVHIHLPEELKYPTADEFLEELNQEVRQYFPDLDHISCEVLQGPVQFDLWHETWEKEIDLFIAGSKPKHKGRGLIPRRFVRKSFCSVLLVPFHAPKQIDRIWIPTDFSERSGKAYELAIQLASQMKQKPELSLHHVYQLPHAYFYKGFPKETILEAIKQTAEDKCKAFNKQYNTHGFPNKVIYSKLSGTYIATDIQSQAMNHQADLILMAAGGKSRFSNLFLGSETEQMAQHEHQIPLFIVKQKRDYVKLWDLVSPN